MLASVVTAVSINRALLERNITRYANSMNSSKARMELEVAKAYEHKRGSICMLKAGTPTKKLWCARGVRGRTWHTACLYITQ